MTLVNLKALGFRPPGKSYYQTKLTSVSKFWKLKRLKMSESPRKRSCKDLLAVTPNKSRSNRRVVDAFVASIVDGTFALVIAKFAGRPNLEPCTNPTRVAILNKTPDENDPSEHNKLIKAGFFNVVVLCSSPDNDTAVRTTRGYDYKAFIASKEEVFTTEAMEDLGNVLAQVRFKMAKLARSINLNFVCSSFKILPEKISMNAIS